jgi:hypothetical protein
MESALINTLKRNWVNTTEKIYLSYIISRGSLSYRVVTFNNEC